MPTAPVLVKVNNDLHSVGWNSQSSVLILLDLSGVFDMADHSFLLASLVLLRFQDVPLSLFSSYFTGLSFSVSFAGSSSYLQLSVGVL